MKITKKIRIVAFMCAFLVLVLTVSTFADGFTEDTDEDYYTFTDDNGEDFTVRVDYNNVPFLSLEMAVGSTSKQGYFQVPWYVLTRQEVQEFVVADQYTFDIRFTSLNDFVFVPKADLTVDFRPSAITLVEGEYQGIWTMHFRSSGDLYVINPETDERVFQTSGNFVMAFKIGTAVYTGSGGNELVRFDAYRDGFVSQDGNGYTTYIQRAVLSTCKVGNEQFDFTGGTPSMRFNFYLPLQSLGDMGSLNFLTGETVLKLSQLLYMVNFDLSDFNFTNGNGYAWKLRYSEEFANTFFNQGYGMGESAGLREGNELGYNRGYKVGYSDGARANQAGAYNEGYQTGYQKGKQEGLQAADVGNFGDLFSGIFNGIYGVFHSVVGFEIPIGDTSINFQHVVGAIIGLLVVGFIVSLFMKTKE